MAKNPFLNTDESYGGVSRLFHWLIAALIFILLIVGFAMADMALSETKLKVYGLHKSFGLVVLALGVMRLLWRVLVTFPKPLPTHAFYERILAKTIHIVFYVSIIAMPLSGWLMSSAGEYSVNFFGLYEMPKIFPKDEKLFDFFREVHELFAFALMISIGLHIAGAIKHQLIDRDRTMTRMGASMPVAILGLAFLGLAGGMLLLGELKEDEVRAAMPSAVEAQSLPVQSNAREWVIDMAGSSIEFEFTQSGQPVTGHFENWGGEIHFDPDRPEAGAALIRIDPSSLRTGSADRDGQARGEDWFAVSAHPSITFMSKSFRALEDGRFEVTGNLALRGITQIVSFPFTLDIQENEFGMKTALMKATLVLKRRDFGVGQGAWQSTDVVGNPVRIVLNVKASTRQPENSD